MRLKFPKKLRTMSSAKNLLVLIKKKRVIVWNYSSCDNSNLSIITQERSQFALNTWLYLCQLN